MLALVIQSLLRMCLTVESAKITNRKTCTKYPCLIFQEDFNKLDFSVWEHLKTAANTGNNEFQYYVNNRSNSFVNNSVLFIKPTLTNDTYSDDFLTSGILDLWGGLRSSDCTSNRRNRGCYVKGSNASIINPIQSAALRTATSFSFKYGVIDVRAKVPKGDWIWPAIWLLPKHYAYGRWPASGEIDILETRGNSDLKFNTPSTQFDVGNKMISQSLHWGPNYLADTQYKTASYTFDDRGSFADKFHLYSLKWTKDSIQFFVDKKVTLNVTIGRGGFWELGGFNDSFPGMHNPWKTGSKMAPFDQEFYIVMNVAVGGTNEYFNHQFVPKPPWSNHKKGSHSMKEFWKARNKWMKSWHGNDVALKIDYIKVWSLKD